MISIEVKKSRYMPGDSSLYLTFAYNESVLNIIRSYPKRSWHKKTKEWELSIDELPSILSDFQNQDIEISGEYVDLTPRKKVTEINFDFKTEPFSHQRDSFLYGMNHDKWFLGDEMGLGKSKQAIDIAIKLKQERGYKHCLIICGVNGLKWNWQQEVGIHSDEEGWILGQRIKKKTGELYIAGNKAKKEDLSNFSSISAYFIITNVESLRDDGITDSLVRLIDSKQIQMAVVDECHKMKNPNSQQGKAFLEIKPEYRLAMTGTPLMNSPLDLYIILRWLGRENHTFWSFKQYYCVMGGYGGYEIIGYRHLDELENELNNIMLRRLKDDVLDLPEKVYISEYVDMLPKQSVLYKEVKSDIQMNIDKVEVSPNPLASMIRLRQVTGYPGILSSTIKCSAKLDRMEELVEDYLSLAENKKVVIFSNWTSMTDAAYERLQAKNPLVITGETPDNVRQQYIDDFQTTNNHSVMIGTIGALGTGVTITKATIVIFLDEPWSRALREQAIDRVHRIGQSSKVTVHTIMCKNTIDERIHDIVEKKGKMSDIIVDGETGKISREMIEYLLS